MRSNHPATHVKRVLWWGRFDPEYSRNRILRQAYAALGWEVIDFHPKVSELGDLEALLHTLPRVDLIHVPCFRQRDLAPAARFSRRREIPLLFDPLISAYDKQVFERTKFSEQSTRSRRLLKWEAALFARTNVVLTDTDGHADFFSETLGVPPDRLQVVYVGAEEALFKPETVQRAANKPLDILFYGSFIPLQGPQIIVEAARLCQEYPIRWALLGSGPLLKDCINKARGLLNITFENWLPYTSLPARIQRADILLGVFGTTPKTQRVIPNKVFQAMACGKPLVTCSAPVYPGAIRNEEDGIFFIDAGNPAALARTLTRFLVHPERLHQLGRNSRVTYERYFSFQQIKQLLADALLNPHLGLRN